MDTYARRRARLALLVEQKARGNIAEFARSYGYSRSQISQFLSDTYNGGRSIGERAARTLEEKVGRSVGWLDLELTEKEQSALDHPFSTAELRVATNKTKPIDTSPYAPYLARIPITAEIVAISPGKIESLDFYDESELKFLEYYSPEAHHAARVMGWGLRPRVKNGEYLITSHLVRPQPGDDVVVRFKNDPAAVVHFLYERDGECAFGSVNDGAPTIIVNSKDIDMINVIISIVHRDAALFEQET